MKRGPNTGKIAKGLDVWLEGAQRAASKKVEFGIWWRLDTSYWRVLWLEATEELYAQERGESDRFILLTHLSKQELKVLMNQWFDGDNLLALIHRLGPKVVPVPAVEHKL